MGPFKTWFKRKDKVTHCLFKHSYSVVILHTVAGDNNTFQFPPVYHRTFNIITIKTI